MYLIHLHGLYPQRIGHDTSFDTLHQNIWIDMKVSQLFSLNGFKFEHLLHWLTNTVKLRIIYTATIVNPIRSLFIFLDDLC